MTYLLNITGNQVQLCRDAAVWFSAEFTPDGENALSELLGLLKTGDQILVNVDPPGPIAPDGSVSRGAGL
jgi:hypothetical protein